MRSRLPRTWFIIFGGDPSDDKECYKRYVSAEPINPIGFDEECVEVREVLPFPECAHTDEENRLAEAHSWEMFFDFVPTAMASFKAGRRSMMIEKQKSEDLRRVLENVRSQMCWEADRDQLTMGMADLHDSVTKVLADTSSQS